MNHTPLLDAAGRLRSPATMPGFHRGRPPRSRGLRYPADPPPVEEVVAVMRVAGESAYGLRTRALIVVLWRAGLRISEALALAESDLDRDRGAILVRRGKGGKRREVGMVGTDRPVAAPPLLVARRSVALRGPRSDAGSPMVGRGCSRDASPPCAASRRASSLRASSASARTRCRDGS
jgi:integrase